MKPSTRLLLLILLAFALGVGFFVNQRMRKGATAPPRQAALAPISPPAIQNVGSAPVVPIAEDGSFNPTPPRKIPLNKPEEYRKDYWKNNYVPAWKRLSAARTGPAIHAFPFLDQTATGVGSQFTYGARFIVAGAVALWTNANVINGSEPPRLGIPEPGQMRDATAEDWARVAFADPAAASADYVITGLFSNALPLGGEGASSKKIQVRLKVYAYSRDLKAVELFDSTVTLPDNFGWYGFNTLDAFVGKMARGLPDALEAAGIAKVRKGDTPSAPALGPELREVAFMLDSSDSWTIMEGIDRALSLAAFYPDKSAPLQAASLGYGELALMYFDQNLSRPLERPYAYRGRSLATLALAIDEESASARTAWLLNMYPTGVMLTKYISSIDSDNPITKAPGLAELNIALTHNTSKLIADEQIGRIPDWITLLTQSALCGYRREGPYEDFVNARMDHWMDYDLFAHTFADSRSYGYQGGENTFASFVQAAHLAALMTSAAEISAIGVTLPMGPDRASYAADASRLTGVASSVLESAWSKKDYFGSRKIILGAISNSWRPIHPGHPIFEVISKSVQPLKTIAADPASWKTVAGVSSLEFPPAERAIFHHNNISLGPIIMMGFASDLRGSVHEIMDIGEASLAADPNHAPIKLDYYNRLRKYAADRAVWRRLHELESNLIETNPIHPASYFSLGANHMVDSARDPSAKEKGLLLLTEGIRIDPHWAWRHEKIGEIARRIGANAVAAQLYVDLFKHMPGHLQHSNTWASIMIDMGEIDLPELESALANTVQAWYGHYGYWNQYIEFLLFDKKDYAAARAAAERMRAELPVQGVSWLARIEVEDPNGDPKKAVEWVESTDLSKYQGLQLVSMESELAGILIHLKRLDLAEAHAKKAWAIDSWKGDAIDISARLAFEKGDYAKCIAEYEREIDRYGENPALRLRIAEALIKSGKAEEGEKTLIKIAHPENPLDAHIPAFTMLIKRAVEKKDAPLANKLMQELLANPKKTARQLRKSLDAYEQIEPKKAAEIRSKMKELLRGPDLKIGSI